MRVGIIGAGAIGGTLGRALVRLGHDVKIANSRGPESLSEYAAESGVRAVDLTEVVRDVAVVIVSVPQAAVPRLPADLFTPVGADVVVIDTGNYYPAARDGEVPGLDTGVAESRWVSTRLGRPVLKSFNNIGAASLRDAGKPAGTPDRIALPVAGDDDTAKAVAMALVEELGFDALDGGSLDESWRQQPGTPAYCHDLDTPAMTQALAAADREHLDAYRRDSDALAQQIMASMAAQS